MVSLHTHTGRNRIHWSERARNAGGRHERSVASKECGLWASVFVVVSEPKGNWNSEGLKSDRSASGESPCSSDSNSFPSKASTLGVGGPADDSESGDPGVSVTISTGSAGDGAGEVGGEVLIANTLSRSADKMSCRSTGDSGSSLGVEGAVEHDGDEERFDELERFR